MSVDYNSENIVNVALIESSNNTKKNISTSIEKTLGDNFFSDVVKNISNHIIDEEANNTRKELTTAKKLSK